MNCFKIFIFTFFFSIIQFIAVGQERGKLFSKYFSPAEYNIGTQNWDIAQDANGILYFGNQHGLCEFDGTKWALYPFPGSTIRTLEITKNGYILAGGINEFGYYAIDKTGKLRYKSLKYLVDSAYRNFGDVWNVEIINDSWFFQTDKYLFRIKANKCKIWNHSGEYFYYSYKLKNQLYIQDLGKGLFKIEGDSLKPLFLEGLFAQKKILCILPYKDNLLVGTRTNGLYLVDLTSGKIISLSDVSIQAKALNQFYIENGIYSGIVIENDKYAVGTIDAGALVINNDFKVTDVIDKNSCGLNQSIYFMHYSKDGDLWLALDNGIQKVELATPLRYWDAEAGMNGSATKILEKDTNFYISSTRGVFYMEKNDHQNLFGINRIVQISSVTEQAWSLININSKSLKKSISSNGFNRKVLAKHSVSDDLLLAVTSKGFITITDARAKILFNYEDIYSVYPSIIDSGKFYLGLRNGLARISYENGTWYDEGKLSFYNQQTNHLAQDERGNLWFAGVSKGVSKIPNEYLDCSKYPDFGKIPDAIVNYGIESGLPGAEGIRIYTVNNQIKFMADSGNYVFNAESNKFIEDPGIGSNYLDSTWINHVFIELNGKYWINAVDSYKKDGKYYGDSLIFKKIYKYLISFAVRDSSSRIWIGTTDGIFCYHEKYKKNYQSEFPAIIRKVILNNDSVIFSGYTYIQDEKGEDFSQDYLNQINFIDKIPYELNSISFDYTCTSFEGDIRNEYSYKLEGFDGSWSNWSPEFKKAYTNLPEGKYIFRIKAKNFYGIESKEAIFRFEISSPWYRSILAYIIYILLLVLFFIVAVKIYTKRLINEKEKLENIVLMRTQEILMQNEEILVQAENLKDANEKIQAKNFELEAQKSELEKRKDELEVSNATKNKFFRIIAHDLRSPISSFSSITNFILNEFEGQEWEKTKTFLNELNKLSQTTFNLLENLLEWSTNQMGEIRYIPKILNITGLINENIELILNRVEIKMIKVFSNLPPKLEVFADENMVNTIIRNLLSNAVKFTNENGNITISYLELADFIEIRISDSGIGISVQDIDKLFKIDKHFSKPGTKNEKGSGLGLILCKDFIEKNGGVLKVYSILGEGSTFSFTLRKA